MSKKHIAVLIFGAVKRNQSFVYANGQLYGVDELLTMFLGREVSEVEAQEFLTHELA